MFQCVKRARQNTNTNNEQKYTALLHIETSKKRFIIKLDLFQPFSANLKGNYNCNRMSAHGTVQ